MTLFTIDTTNAWETCPGSNQRPASITRRRKKDGTAAAGACPHCKPDNATSSVRLNGRGELKRHYRLADTRQNEDSGPDHVPAAAEYDLDFWLDIGQET